MGGDYNISGSFEYSIIIDTSEKVILNLNNVTINSAITASIVNINTWELIINLLENTTNIVKDNGSSEYDGCIYSNGKLIIQGSGSLYVYGNQEEGEGIATTDNDIIINGGKIYTMGSSPCGDLGIDTDGIFEINGGELIALGSDMLQNPNNSSKQKYVSFTINSKISKDTNISLKDSSNKEIISFLANEDFKTIIISNDILTTGTYYLYINYEKTEYSKIID